MFILIKHNRDYLSYILNIIATSHRNSVHSVYSPPLISPLHLIARLFLPLVSPPTTTIFAPLSPSPSKLLPPQGSEGLFGCCLPIGPIQAASNSAGAGFACLGNAQKSQRERAKEIRCYTRQSLSFIFRIARAH